MFCNWWKFSLPKVVTLRVVNSFENLQYFKFSWNFSQKFLLHIFLSFSMEASGGNMTSHERLSLPGRLLRLTIDSTLER